MMILSIVNSQPGLVRLQFAIETKGANAPGVNLEILVLPVAIGNVDLGVRLYAAVVTGVPAPRASVIAHDVHQIFRHPRVVRRRVRYVDDRVVAQRAVLSLSDLHLVPFVPTMEAPSAALQERFLVDLAHRCVRRVVKRLVVSLVYSVETPARRGQQLPKIRLLVVRHAKISQIILQTGSHDGLAVPRVSPPRMTNRSWFEVHRVIQLGVDVPFVLQVHQVLRSSATVTPVNTVQRSTLRDEHRQCAPEHEALNDSHYCVSRRHLFFLRLGSARLAGLCKEYRVFTNAPAFTKSSSR